MFNDKHRPFKEENQQTAQDWILENTTQKFLSVGLSGGNAINSVKSIGRVSKDITLYEIDEPTARLAMKNYKTNHSSYGLPIKLIHDDIYGMDYRKYNLFYFDFCNIHRSVRFDDICDGVTDMVKKNKPKEFVVMFTLPIHGVGITKKTTFKSFKKFAENMMLSCSHYAVKLPDSLFSYKGGENGTGMHLCTFPMVFYRSSFDKVSQCIEKLKTKKFADKITTSKKGSLNKETYDEISKLIDSKKFTNKEIANKYKLSVGKVAAMASWHTGKLAKRRKGGRSKR